jgi:hypothetical protein
MHHDDPAAASEATSPPTYKPDSHIALDRIVYDSLRPASAGLEVLYTILALSHALVLPKAPSVPMTLMAGGSAGAFAGLYYLLGRKQFPLSWAHPIGMVVFALVLLNSLLYLDLTFEPYQSTNFALLILGAGCLFPAQKLVCCICIVSGGELVLHRLVCSPLS